MHSDKARRIAFDALFAALALMFTFVEIKLPVSAAIPIPGFRLGLANIAVMAEYRQPALFFTLRANLPFPLHFSAERRFSAPYI